MSTCSRTGGDQTDGMLTISMGPPSDSVTISKNYVLGWIESQLSNGKIPTEIVLDSINPNGQTLNLTLTHDVWQRSLLRGGHAPAFSNIWNKYNETALSRKTILGECIALSPNFSEMCVKFCNDLRVYDSDNAAHDRLHSTGHEFFLGMPYFDPDVVANLLTLPTYKEGTLASELRSLADKRLEYGNICAFADLGPLYSRIMLVKWNKAKGKNFHEHGDIRAPIIPLVQPDREEKKGKKGKGFMDTVKSTFSRKSGSNSGSGQRKPSWLFNK